MTLIRFNAGVYWNDAFSVFATNPPAIRMNTHTFSKSTHVRSVFSDIFIVFSFLPSFSFFFLLIQRITYRKGRFGRIIVAGISFDVKQKRIYGTVHCIQVHSNLL